MRDIKRSRDPVLKEWVFMRYMGRDPVRIRCNTVREGFRRFGNVRFEYEHHSCPRATIRHLELTCTPDEAGAIVQYLVNGCHGSFPVPVMMWKSGTYAWTEAALATGEKVSKRYLRGPAQCVDDPKPAIWPAPCWWRVWGSSEA